MDAVNYTWAGDYNRPLSLNRWNYVEGNPVNFTDPSGQCIEPISFFWCVVISSAIIGGVTAIAWDVFVVQEKGVPVTEKLLNDPIGETLRNDPIGELSLRLNPFDPRFDAFYCDVDWLEAIFFGGVGVIIGGFTGASAELTAEVYRYLESIGRDLTPDEKIHQGRIEGVNAEEYIRDHPDALTEPEGGGHVIETEELIRMLKRSKETLQRARDTGNLNKLAEQSALESILDAIRKLKKLNDWFNQ